MTNAEYLKALRVAAAAAGWCYTCRCRKPQEGKRNCEACITGANRYAREIYKRRRAQGLCPCGAPPIATRTRCEACLVATRERVQAATDMRTAQGLCRSCPALLVPGHRQCEACLAAQVERNRAGQQARIAAGRCRVAGCTLKLAKGHTMCRLCLADMREKGSPQPSHRRAA